MQNTEYSLAAQSGGNSIDRTKAKLYVHQRKQGHRQQLLEQVYQAKPHPAEFSAISEDGQMPLLPTEINGKVEMLFTSAKKVQSFFL